MKKVLFSLLLLAFGLSAMAQQIQLRSADKAECVKSDMTSLKASFSFSTIAAEDYNSERGTFSWLSMPNTVIGGNEGDPQIPVINQLIAVPFGAQPRIEVTSYSTTDYRLEDLGIKTLVPRQPSLRKDKRPEDVPFVYNANAYQTRGLRSEPTATVGVEGTMRGVQLGKMTIEPVSYDPVNNTLRVFNDIEVTVHFDGADARATEDMLIKTYSPYFDIVYKQLFNGRAIMDAYSDHTDLYTTPVKMLVVATSAYQSSTAFQNWLTWKKQKGIDVDIYTVTSSTASSTIRTEIQSRYNANHPTFLVIIGDETVVKAYKTNWSCGSTYGNCINDMEYASVDNDVYHDMYMSRMSVSSTTELENLVNKILTYEKYTMSDPSYLNNSLLVAGWDSNWTSRVGKPTIQYANNNYYNSAHGINPTVFITTGSGQTAAWNNINNVGFVNYTAHGDIQELADPEFTNTNANNMTNNDKYLWIVANCCLTANWGNNTYKPCLGETMIRAANKGAFGYIGSIPESYWYEDYYFGVGAFSYVAGTVQTPSSTTTGMYDAAFDDTGFNTLNSMPYIGNVAVTYAHAAGYTSSVTDEYYWRAYQCLGDGSVMPYLNNPVANNVSHASSLSVGVSSFDVHADAGSYVSITVNNEIIGVAAVPANATSVSVPITAQATPGTAMIVVTRNQRQPYITTIPIVGGTKYTITAAANPSNGGTVSGAGQYYGNTSCTLTATPNAHYDFVNWKKGNSVVSTNPTYTFTVTENASYTANFVALQPHSVTCNPVENGSISANPTTAYKNETVTLSATPASGYFFASWDVRDANNNSITVTDNQFTMPDSDVTVTATFVSGCTVTVAEVEHGTVAASATGGAPGTTITLTATPEADYFLSTWLVFKTGDVNTTVAVTNNQFVLPAYDVTVVGIFKMTQEAEIAIGSGASASSYLPTYAYYNYSLTQQIFTSSEIGQAGTITAIAFKVGNSKSTTRTVDVYLSHTTKSAFTGNSDWVSQSTAYRVFSGSVTFASSDWTTITLDTPFEYDGTSNLLLTVDDNTGSYVSSSSNSPSFYVYSASGYTSIYKYNDNTNYNPASMSTSGSRLQQNNQVTFTMTTGAGTASLAVSPNAMDGFSYAEGYGPSAVKSLAVIGVDLSGDITVTAPADFEISDAENGTYGSTLTLTASNRSGRETLTYDFEDGWQGWTAIKGSDGTSPNNWMHNTEYTAYDSNGSQVVPECHNASSGMMLSESYISAPTSGGSGTAVYPDNYLVSPQIQLGGSITFYAASRMSNYPAETFYVVVSESGNTNASDFTHTELEVTLTDNSWQEYTVDLSAYSGMGYVAIRHYNCYDQHLLYVDDITIVEGGDAPVGPTNPTTDLLTANVYVRLKVGLGQGVYNETLSVATADVTSNVGLNGEVYPTLAAGCNWWTPTKAMTLVQLEEALGNNAVLINSQNAGFARYENGTWSGTLTEIVPGQMYKIETSDAVSLTMSGTPATGVSLTIMPGYNWFGYTGNQAKAIAAALGDFTPSNGDTITAQDGATATYNNGSWNGTLNTLQPGHGYIYLKR